jgi:glycosyltransferase involved in cell wall biosynthesis
VYGRVQYVGAERRVWRGVHVVPVRSPRGKHVETPLHTLATALRARRAQHDVVLLCNAANAFALPLFRGAGARTVLNVDGIERMRRKWGTLGRLWYALGERLALGLADRPLADAQVIHDYYRLRYGRHLALIPYGGDRAPPGLDLDRVRRFGLEPGGYVLAVQRLEPENNALHLVRSYARVAGDRRLVIVGDAPYANAYKASLLRAADHRVHFTGGVYGPDYFALLEAAACYVAAGEVGGTHPALLEAMSTGRPVVANDVPEHREVLGDAGLYYAPGDEIGLGRALECVLEDPALATRLGAKVRARIRERYRWEDVTDRYEALFQALLETPATVARVRPGLR